MKTAALTAIAAFVAVAGTAQAQTFEPQLTNNERLEIHLLAPEASLDNLSENQVIAVKSALHSGDGSAAEVRTALQ